MNKKILQIFQILLVILTFILLFGKYYNLKINSILGFFSFAITVILTIIIIIITTKELIKKRSFLPLEITTLVNSIVILIITTVFLIVYFILETIY